jgi:hypothetical protein
MRPIVVMLVTAGVMLVAGQSADAKRWQSAGSKPGLGVSGVGVSTVFVPAPGVVATPGVRSPGITTPAVAGTPGVSSRNIGTSSIAGSPGVSAPSVATRGVETAPGVPTSAPGVEALPRGYYTTIPSTAVQTMHRGETCYFAAGVYYRPEYYLGSLVYVVVP